jgi:hypothetical protein
MRAMLGNQRTTTARRGSHLLSGHTHTLPDNQLASDDPRSHLRYL